MKYFLLSILIGLSVLLGSCSEKEKSVTVISRNDNQMMVLNLKNTNDSIQINLTDFTSDLRFIRLETRPDCLISSATYYLTDRYILARTKTGIYQFDAHGKFIRLLVSRGQGPLEYSAAEWVVDEKNDRLIIADEQKTEYFLCFDLKTGEYLYNIPKAIPGVTRKFSLTEYGSLACVPYMSPGNQPDLYYLYWQDLKGQLIDVVKGPQDLAIYRDNYLEKVPDGYRYMLAYSNKDTIYTLKDKKLIPFLAFNHGEEVPESMEAEGYRTMKIALETSNFLFLYKNQISKVNVSGDNTSISWVLNDYLLDKTHLKAFQISGIYNDFTGTNLHIQMLKGLPNGIIYCQLQAMELIGIAERAIENPKSEQKLIGRMEEIRDQIGRDDNPVLLVGRLR